MTDDPKLALIRRNAEAGDAEAQTTLGRIYAEGSMVPRDLDAARRWFLAAAAQGSPKAKHNVGVLAFQAAPEGEADEALGWFEQAATSGWVESMTALGLIYRDRADEDRAMHWFGRAAAEGDAVAQDGLSRLYVKRENDPESLALALDWAKRAAAQGLPEANAQLGMIYHEGLGVERDDRRSHAHYMLAAQAGHSGAQLSVGVGYHRGVGVDADLVEAFVWLVKSALADRRVAALYARQVWNEMTPAQKMEVQQRIDAGEH